MPNCPRSSGRVVNTVPSCAMRILPVRLSADGRGRRGALRSPARTGGTAGPSGVAHTHVACCGNYISHMPDSRAIKHVLATVDYGPDQLRHLADAFAPARFTHVAADDEAGIRDALATADVAVLRSDLDQRFLGAPALRWVHCDHAGPERSASPAVFERGLIVTSSAGRSA